MKLLHIHREILELAAQSSVGPTMPPPPEIEEAVAALLGEGLPSIREGTVRVDLPRTSALKWLQTPHSGTRCRRGASTPSLKPEAGRG